MNLNDLPIAARRTIDLYLDYLNLFADPDQTFDLTYILDASILTDMLLDLDRMMILRLALDDDAPLPMLIAYYDADDPTDIRHITLNFDTYINTIHDSTYPTA